MPRVHVLFFLLFVISSVSTRAQQSLTITGSIYDSVSREPLPATGVYLEGLSWGVTADINGQYKLVVPAGKHRIVFSLIGYEKVVRELTIDKDLQIDVALTAIASEMSEVVITGRHADENIKDTETGRVTLTHDELEKLPYLLGESDPIRILQLLPGVQTAGEGNTGFYVRGGAIDQNLIMLDNSIVYNPSHLFGFFSVFNGGIVNDVELYKSGIPAYYGGRLSSITRVGTRKGNDQELQGEAGIGIVAANILVEGPIKKSKGSFMVAARRSYVDLFLEPLGKLLSFNDQVDYHFYDLNINADYELTERDFIKLRAYRGNDSFDYKTSTSFSNNINWGNTTAAVQWLRRYNKNLFGELTAGIVTYNMDFGAGISNYNFSIFSNIIDYNAQYRFDLTKGKHALTFGLEYTRHTLRPNNVKAAASDVELDFNNNVKLHADEASIFFNDQIEISTRLQLNVGLRASGFRQLGPFTRYVVDNDLQILDTIAYNRGSKIVDYANLEPRIALRFSIDNESSVKASFDRGYQYMHMAPLSSASLPMDVWVTSSTRVRPQYANQYTAGYFRNYPSKHIEASAVLYYKDMYNQLEYRDGVIIGYSKGFNYDDNFVFGRGTSYGAELLIRKTRGRANGLVAYTLSRTTRKFDELNAGKSFPAKYDRLHDLSFLLNYELNKKWTFSGVFVYGTGNALNLPVARYVIQGNVVNEYGDRNSFRMPAYHRFDFAATYVTKRRDRFESAWIFSVYNVYNRRNPYYIYFENTGDLSEYKLQTNLKQVSLFPVLPSVTYRIKF